MVWSFLFSVNRLLLQDSLGRGWKRRPVNTMLQTISIWLQTIGKDQNY